MPEGATVMHLGPASTGEECVGRADILCVEFPVGDLENVTEGVAHHRPAVPVRRVEGRFQGYSASSNRPLVGAVCVIDVDVEERWEGVALAGLAHHDERVTDPHLCWTSDVDLAGRGEDGPEEVDLPGHIGDDDARRH